jgi:hypothetical protein
MKVASTFGADVKTVRGHLKRLGVYKLPPSAKRMTPTVRKIIVECYLQGYSTAEIRRKIGFSRTSIQKFLKTRGIIRSIKESKLVSCYRNINPLPLNPSLSTLLGIHAGDGSLSSGNNRTQWRANFHKNELELAEYVTVLLKNLFSINAKLRPRDNEIIVSFWNKQLLITLLQYGFKNGKKAHIVGVPPQVLSSTDYDVMRAFLCGLLAADGCVCMIRPKRKRPYLAAEFCTVSSRLAGGVAQLLAKLGYKFSISKSNSKNSYGKIPRIKIHICGGREAMIKFLNDVSMINPVHRRKFHEFCREFSSP